VFGTVFLHFVFPEELKLFSALVAAFCWFLNILVHLLGNEKLCGLILYSAVHSQKNFGWVSRRTNVLCALVVVLLLILDDMSSGENETASILQVVY